MKEFIVLTVIISVASAVFSLLLPKSEVKKSFNVLLGSVMIFVMIQPAGNFYSDISDIDFDMMETDYSLSLSEKSEDVILAAVKEGYENLLKEHLMKSFHNIADVEAFIEKEGEYFKTYKIIITLKSSDISRKEVEEMVYSIIEDECEVVYINE